MEDVRAHMLRCSSSDPLSRVQYADFKTYLPGDILTKVDRASMANSLEVRVPLLDHELVEFAFALPLKLKLHEGNRKRILRRVMRRHFSDARLSAPKKGFRLPIDLWMKGELKEWTR